MDPQLEAKFAKINNIDDRISAKADEIIRFLKLLVGEDTETVPQETSIVHQRFDFSGENQLVEDSIDDTVGIEVLSNSEEEELEETVDVVVALHGPQKSAPKVFDQMPIQQSVSVNQGMLDNAYNWCVGEKEVYQVYPAQQLFDQMLAQTSCLYVHISTCWVDYLHWLFKSGAHDKFDSYCLSLLNVDYVCCLCVGDGLNRLKPWPNFMDYFLTGCRVHIDITVCRINTKHGHEVCWSKCDAIRTSLEANSVCQNLDVKLQCSQLLKNLFSIALYAFIGDFTCRLASNQVAFVNGAALLAIKFEGLFVRTCKNGGDRNRKVGSAGNNVGVQDSRSGLQDWTSDITTQIISNVVLAIESGAGYALSPDDASPLAYCLYNAQGFLLQVMMGVFSRGTVNKLEAINIWNFSKVLSACLYQFKVSVYVTVSQKVTTICSCEEKVEAFCENDYSNDDNNMQLVPMFFLLKYELLAEDKVLKLCSFPTVFFCMYILEYTGDIIVDRRSVSRDAVAGLLLILQRLLSSQVQIIPSTPSCVYHSVLPGHTKLQLCIDLTFTWLEGGSSILQESLDIVHRVDSIPVGCCGRLVIFMVGSVEHDVFYLLKYARKCFESIHLLECVLLLLYTWLHLVLATQEVQKSRGVSYFNPSVTRVMGKLKTQVQYLVLLKALTRHIVRTVGLSIGDHGVFSDTFSSCVILLHDSCMITIWNPGVQCSVFFMVVHSPQVIMLHAGHRDLKETSIGTSWQKIPVLSTAVCLSYGIILVQRVARRYLHMIAHWSIHCVCCSQDIASDNWGQRLIHTSFLWYTCVLFEFIAKTSQRFLYLGYNLVQLYTTQCHLRMSLCASAYNALWIWFSVNSFSSDRYQQYAATYAAWLLIEIWLFTGSCQTHSVQLLHREMVASNSIQNGLKFTNYTNILITSSGHIWHDYFNWVFDKTRLQEQMFIPGRVCIADNTGAFKANANEMLKMMRLEWERNKGWVQCVSFMCENVGTSSNFRIRKVYQHRVVLVILAAKNATCYILLELLAKDCSYEMCSLGRVADTPHKSYTVLSAYGWFMWHISIGKNSGIILELCSPLPIDISAGQVFSYSSLWRVLDIQETMHKSSFPHYIFCYDPGGVRGCCFFSSVKQWVLLSYQLRFCLDYHIKQDSVMLHGYLWNFVSLLVIHICYPWLCSTFPLWLYRNWWCLCGSLLGLLLLICGVSMLACA